MPEHIKYKGIRAGKDINSTYYGPWTRWLILTSSHTASAWLGGVVIRSVSPQVLVSLQRVTQ